MEYCSVCEHPHSDHKEYGNERHCNGLKPKSKQKHNGAVYLTEKALCDCKGFVQKG